MVKLNLRYKQVFEDLYQPEPMSGCWIWLRQLGYNGYGRIVFNKKAVYAHRFSAFVSGIIKSIDQDICICHRCDNRACINPSHLYAGTQKQNMMDSVLRGRSRALVSLEDSEVIFKLGVSGAKRSHIISMFPQYSPCVVASIIYGKSKKHLGVAVKRHRRILSTEQKEEVRRLRDLGLTLKEVSKRVGFSFETVRRALLYKHEGERLE